MVIGTVCADKPNRNGDQRSHEVEEFGVVVRPVDDLDDGQDDHDDGDDEDVQEAPQEQLE